MWLHYKLRRTWSGLHEKRNTLFAQRRKVKDELDVFRILWIRGCWHLLKDKCQTPRGGKALKTNCYVSCSQHYLRSSLWNNGSVVTIDLLHRMFCQTKSTRLYKHCRSENDKWESNWENSCTPWPAVAQSAPDRENRIVHRDAKSSRSGRYPGWFSHMYSHFQYQQLVLILGVTSEKMILYLCYYLCYYQYYWASDISVLREWVLDDWEVKSEEKISFTSPEKCKVK